LPNRKLRLFATGEKRSIQRLLPRNDQSSDHNLWWCGAKLKGFQYPCTGAPHHAEIPSVDTSSAR
jgi:hypothetical protein